MIGNIVLMMGYAALTWASVAVITIIISFFYEKFPMDKVFFGGIFIMFGVESILALSIGWILLINGSLLP